MTLESLLIDYGSPEQIAAGAEQAAKDMRRWEKHCLQALAEELRHSRTQAKNAKLALEAVDKAESELREMGLTGLNRFGVGCDSLFFSTLSKGDKSKRPANHSAKSSNLTSANALSATNAL